MQYNSKIVLLQLHIIMTCRYRYEIRNFSLTPMEPMRFPSIPKLRSSDMIVGT